MSVFVFFRDKMNDSGLKIKFHRVPREKLLYDGLRRLLTGPTGRASCRGCKIKTLYSAKIGPAQPA